MLAELGYDSLDALTAATVPESIRLRRPLALPAARGEHELLEDLRATMRRLRRPDATQRIVEAVLERGVQAR